MAGVYHLVGGRRPVVGYAYGRWSVSVSVGGRCFMFLMVGFFRQWSVVGVLSSIWSVAQGRWLVGGRWYCTTPSNHKAI